MKWKRLPLTERVATRACNPFLLLAMTGLACGTVQDKIASRYVKSVFVRADQGALISISSLESEDLAGTSLSIPARALQQDTWVTVELQRNSLAISPDQAASVVASFGPSATQLVLPSSVTLPFNSSDADLDDLLVIQGAPGGPILAADTPTIDTDLRQVRFSTRVLAPVQVVVGGCPSSVHDCTAGTTCMDGKCRMNCRPTRCTRRQFCCRIIGCSRDAGC